MMNEETNQLLRQILEAQKQQNAFLQRYLWRLRFSLLSLLLLMSVLAVGLGFVAFTNKPTAPAAPVAAPPVAAPRVAVPPPAVFVPHPAPSRYRYRAQEPILPDSLPRRTVS
jgi:hypothetical protein